MEITNKYRHAHSIGTYCEEFLLKEGVFGGYSFALVKKFKDHCYTSMKHGSIDLVVDFSRWQGIILSDKIDRGVSFYTDLFENSKIELDFLESPKKSGLYNVSPSLWENGFSRCEYLNYTLLEWQNNRELMKSAITGGITERDLVERFDEISTSVIHQLEGTIMFFSSFGPPLDPTKQSHF